MGKPKSVDRRTVWEVLAGVAAGLAILAAVAPQLVPTVGAAREDGKAPSTCSCRCAVPWIPEGGEPAVLNVQVTPL